MRKILEGIDVQWMFSGFCPLRSATILFSEQLHELVFRIRIRIDMAPLDRD